MEEREISQVIKIIDRYRIVINAGTEDGLSEGDDIEVFISGEELIDQFNSNKPLGTLDYVKEILVIKEVRPKYSICMKEIEERIEIPSDSPFSGLSLALGKFASITQTKIITKTKPLEVDPEEITGGFPEESSMIKIGDLVRRRYI